MKEEEIGTIGQYRVVTEYYQYLDVEAILVKGDLDTVGFRREQVGELIALLRKAKDRLGKREDMEELLTMGHVENAYAIYREIARQPMNDAMETIMNRAYYHWIELVKLYAVQRDMDPDDVRMSRQALIFD